MQYARLSAYPASLFNVGLEAARASRYREARDLFAAVVHWCPLDTEARNAFALACLKAGDKQRARATWEAILEASPRDSTALKGIALLDKSPVRQASRNQGSKGGKRTSRR